MRFEAERGGEAEHLGGPLDQRAEPAVDDDLQLRAVAGRAEPDRPFADRVEEGFEPLARLLAGRRRARPAGPRRPVSWCRGPARRHRRGRGRGRAPRSARSRRRRSSPSAPRPRPRSRRRRRRALTSRPGWRRRRSASSPRVGVDHRLAGGREGLDPVRRRPGRRASPRSGSRRGPGGRRRPRCAPSPCPSCRPRRAAPRPLPTRFRVGSS